MELFKKEIPSGAIKNFPLSNKIVSDITMIKTLMQFLLKVGKRETVKKYVRYLSKNPKILEKFFPNKITIEKNKIIIPKEGELLQILSEEKNKTKGEN